MKYNYFEAVKADVLSYISENINLDEFDSFDDLENALNDELWVADSVTGNASGSYTVNTWQAEENLCHNWDLLVEALREFGYESVDTLNKGAEWCDVTIRCYLLGQAIAEALEEMKG
jgi:hypothetical protein